MAVVHKIKHDGVVYVGRTQADGTTVFDPPLPKDYQAQCDSRLGRVFESRVFPGLNTDTTFLANRGTLDQQIEDPIVLDRVIKGAKKEGYTPKPTDVYISGLADYPGDRKAFVGSDAKGHIRKVCEEKGVGCQGSVNIPMPERRIDPEAAVLRDQRKALAKKMKGK